VFGIWGCFCHRLIVLIDGFCPELAYWWRKETAIEYLSYRVITAYDVLNCNLELPRNILYLP